MPKKTCTYQREGHIPNKYTIYPAHKYATEAECASKCESTESCNAYTYSNITNSKGVVYQNINCVLKTDYVLSTEKSSNPAKVGKCTTS